MGVKSAKQRAGSGAEGRVDILNREGWSKQTKCIMGCLLGLFTSGPQEATDCTGRVSPSLVVLPESTVTDPPKATSLT